MNFAVCRLTSLMHEPPTNHLLADSGPFLHGVLVRCGAVPIGQFRIRLDTVLRTAEIAIVLSYSPRVVRA